MVEKVIRSNFSYIPKSLIKKEKIERDLTIRVKNFQTEETEIQYFYLEDENYYIVPRFYPLYAGLKIEKEILPQPQLIDDIKDHIDLRDDDQVKAYRFLTNLNFDGKILKAPPGFGKTIVTIKAICNLKLKPIIIVPPNEKLLLQWKEKILQFTNLKEDDIALIKGNFKQDDIINKKITIALVSTLASRFKTNEQEYHKTMYLAKFGIAIFDECHSTTATSVFHLANGLVYTKYVIGLSATPFKPDKRTDIIYFHLGFELLDTIEYKLQPKIYEIVYSSNIPPKSRLYFTGKFLNGKFSFTRYLHILWKKSNTFKFLILKLTKKALEKGRKILIIVKKVDNVKELANYLEEALQIQVGRFYAGQSEKEFQHKVIVATYQSFKEGIDVPDLDTLICTELVANRTAIEQLIGRILRRHPNKKQPIAFFLVDKDYEVTMKLHKLRKKVYEACKFEYEVIDIK